MVRRLRANVLGLKAEVDHREEVLRQAQEGLQAVTEERNSLAKSLEDERFVGQALDAQIEGVLLISRFSGLVFCLNLGLMPLSTFQVLRKIWTVWPIPWSNRG